MLIKRDDKNGKRGEKLNDGFRKNEKIGKIE